MDIIFACSKEDKEFCKLVNENFTGVEELENYSFSGMEEMVLFMVPIISLSVQIIDFIFTHMKDTSNDRYVVINGKKKYFYNFSKDEIIEILQSIKDE